MLMLFQLEQSLPSGAARRAVAARDDAVLANCDRVARAPIEVTTLTGRPFVGLALPHEVTGVRCGWRRHGVRRQVVASVDVFPSTTSPARTDEMHGGDEFSLSRRVDRVRAVTVTPSRTNARARKRARGDQV